MDTLNLNYVDYIFLAIFLFYLLIGLQRGLVRQVLGLISLGVALVLAVMFSSQIAAQFMNSASFQNAMTNMSASMGVNAEQPISYLVLGLSFVLIFVSVTIVGALINLVISSLVASTGLGFANRILGGLFGLLRGAVTILVIIFVLQLTSVGNQIWWAKSRVVTAYQPAVQFLANMVSPELSALKDKITNTLQNVGNEAQEYTNTLRE